MTMRLAERFLLSLFLIFAIFFPLLSFSEEQKAVSHERTTEQKLSIIEICAWTNRLPKDLIDLKRMVEELEDISDLEEKLVEIEKQLQDLEWETTTFKSNPHLTGHDLGMLQAKIVKFGAKLEKTNKPVSHNIKTLEELYKDWILKEDQLLQILQTMEKDKGLHDILTSAENLHQLLDTAKTLIEDTLRPNLLAGHFIGNLQTKVYELNEASLMLIRDLNETGIQQTSPSMLSREFYEEIDPILFSNGWQNLRLFSAYQWNYLQENVRFVLSALFIMALLSLLIRLSKKAIKPSFTWYQFATNPFMSALFVFCTGCGVINMIAINISPPPDWPTLINLPLLFSVGFFVNTICHVSWQKSLLRQLVFYTGLSIVLTVVDVPQMLFYLFVFYASAILLVYYLIKFLQRWFRGNRHFTWAVAMWGVFPLAVLIVGASGYDQLAVMIFGRILSIVSLTLIISILYFFILGLFELIISLVPYSFITNNRQKILKQLAPVLALLLGILWLSSTLTIVWLYPTLGEAYGALTSLEFKIFSLTVTPRYVLTIIFVLYATILFSNWLRAFLLQEVLPRHKVELGAQISISRLVHYAVLMLGVIILLQTLGFGINQITILGGALGVGVGFGLQAIVNNFVSGLILLFERPLKVGDFIEIGTQVGEVKQLGLRATTVQTFDNAEIVIPNSQLITDIVTNWTLAEKKVRVRVPVGVAYGTDIEKVLQILLSCATSNPLVLDTPKPVALFLAFGTSSLDFELRAWIPNFDDKLTVLSELNQEIESEFETAGVEIPFPQRDLHLRSVNGEAMASFSPQRRETHAPRGVSLSNGKAQ